MEVDKEALALAQQTPVPFRFALVDCPILGCQQDRFTVECPLCGDELQGKKWFSTLRAPCSWCPVSFSETFLGHFGISVDVHESAVSMQDGKNLEFYFLRLKKCLEGKSVELAECPRHGSHPFRRDLHFVNPEEGQPLEEWHGHFYMRCFVQEPISCWWVDCVSVENEGKAKEYEKAYQHHVDKEKDYDSPFWS